MNHTAHSISQADGASNNLTALGGRPREGPWQGFGDRTLGCLKPGMTMIGKAPAALSMRYGYQVAGTGFYVLELSRPGRISSLTLQ